MNSCCLRQVGCLASVLLVSLLTHQTVHAAGSATWALNPVSSDWNTGANWMPHTVPNGPADTATFALSNTTGVSVSAKETEVAAIVFNPDASPFTITANAQAGHLDAELTISGMGITNNSPLLQNFIVGPLGSISFRDAATAGSGTNFTADSGVEFRETSTAGSASFVANGAMFPDSGGGGVNFLDSSTAGNATFTLNASTVDFAYGAGVGFDEFASAGNGVFVLNAPSRSGPYASEILFDANSTAAHGVFTLNGGFGQPIINFNGSATAASGAFTVNGGQGQGTYGGNVYFYGYTFTGITTAGNATFTNNGGNGSGAGGGRTTFSSESTAGEATLIANGGEAGGQGGDIAMYSDSDGGQARVEVFGNGYLDISFHLAPGVTIGSLEGDGLVFLGAQNLTVGSNNLNTTFSGTLQEKGGISNGSQGSLTKIGTGQLLLSGASTYTAGTIVSDGVLRVTNATGSATGTKSVQVNAGTLGGKGIIAGAVTVGTGSGTGAILQPSVGLSQTAKLTIQSALTFKADSTYTYKLSTQKAKADQVVATGVTIESGAQFNFTALANKRLAAGTVFNVISNTTATPISGTFANLAEGSTLTAGRNRLLVSYTGGDGNDLTLTVQ